MATRDFCDATRSERDAVTFLQTRGVLRSTWQCGRGCLKADVKLRERNGSFYHDCSKCSRQKWITAGSWLERTRLTVTQVLDFVRTWCLGVSGAVMRSESGIVSKATSTDWSRFCREICAGALLAADNGVIGGPGHIVEVDESKFSKRKYDRGRHLRKRWVFGGFDRTTRKSFFEFVENRTADTLLEVIIRRVARGSIICSDEFKSYKRLRELGYEHIIVNHSQNFVDPITGAHTQNIECCWGCLKRFLRAVGRNLGPHVSEYFSEYIYRQQHKTNLFEQFWRDVAVQFPPQN